MQGTQEMWVQSLGWEHPLGMAMHSSILAWSIPWTGEPGRLQSIGLQRVGHNWSELHDPMDCSLPGSSIHGIFQARVLEWVAIAFSRTHTTRLSFGPGKWLNYCEPQFDFILNRLHKTYFSEFVLSNGDDYMHAHFQNCIFSNWSTVVLQCGIGFYCIPFHYTFMHVLFLFHLHFFP